MIPEPFGQENMTGDRMSMVLRDIVERDADACVEEAVRFIYYTGSPVRRNVRIMPNYQVAEVWDGSDWWTRSICETMDAMIERAVEEIEFHLDYCDVISAASKDRAELALEAYRSSPQSRERVRARVLEIMISPYGDDF